MPVLRREPGNENKSAKGGYVLLEAEGGERKLTILSTGSELHLAVEARDILQKEGIPTAIVSMPCRLLFEQQEAAYKKAILGTTRARVAVEAAVELGWERYIGFEGRFVGMHSFGASGKIADVYKKFDINAGAVVRAAHADHFRSSPVNRHHQIDPASEFRAKLQTSAALPYCGHMM
jgi:transketolase